MAVRDAFRMPKAVKITGRTSSITNSFVNGIIPVIKPSDDEIVEALKILGMTPETVCCAYCGDPMTEWDHFRPLVVDKNPTGNITEIHNLVPACNKCNQSKGNHNWKEWMLGSAEQSPKSRGISDIDVRVMRLEEYEKWGSPEYPKIIDIKGIIGNARWDQHWKNCSDIKKLMYESQELSDEIKDLISESLRGTVTPATSVSKKCAKGGGAVVISKGDKISSIAKNSLVLLIQDSRFPQNIIDCLCDKKYSKENFDIDNPVLIKIVTPEDYKKRLDDKGYPRYYSKTYFIHGEEYILSSQWFERSRASLIKWINDNSVMLQAGK